MAETFFRARCEERGLAWDARSVGHAAPDRCPPDEVIDAMARRHLDVSSHRSRRMAYGHVSQADLIVGMARSHVREATVILPEAFNRTFTLKEIVRRGEAIGPCHAPLDHWLAWVGVGRRPADLVGSSPDDDVEDPYLRSWRAYLACATELESLTARLVDLLADAQPATTPARPPGPSPERI